VIFAIVLFEKGRRIMKKNLIALLSSLCLSTLSQADSLEALYRAALSSDPQYAAAQAQYTAVEERVPQALAGLLPTLTLNANSTINNNVNTTSFGSSPQNYTSDGYSLNLTLPLLRPQNGLAYEQSRHALVQARAQLELAHQDLIIRLSQAYFDALYAADSLASIQSQREAVAEQLASAKRKFEIGTSSLTDVTDTQARFDLVSAQEIAALNDLEAKHQALRAMINREPGALQRLRADFVLIGPQPAPLQYWLDQAESNGMTVLAGLSALEVARLEAKKASAGHFPTLDAVASNGTSTSATTSTVGSKLQTDTLGLQLVLPLFAGGAISAHERETAALLVKAEAELDGARRSGSLSARQAYLGVKSGVAQTNALSRALESAKTALKSSQRGFEVGVRVNVDVLNARQQLSLTERDLAKSRYDSLMSSLRLKGAAGSLGEVDVREVNALLEGQ
jgi:outer membrane protein